jgi:hypothetical protein
MVLDPVAGDIDPPADPDVGAAGHMIEKARQPRGATQSAGQARMQAHGHHLGRSLALGVEQLEGIPEIGEELVS